ncbi:MAG: phosphomannomutase, partial [Clostridiales bacterium]|nr:phosphomannomutase [Clostridiales bacterium]
MIDKTKIKLVAFDLDGTLTQHKVPLEETNRAFLEALGKKYKLLMAGAGECSRIFNQMGKFPIDILGSYGMQYGEYNEKTGELDIKFSKSVPCDRDSVNTRAKIIRERFGLTEFAGDSVQFFPTGGITLAILGTAAKLPEKLAYDPDRKKRRAMLGDVREMFPDFTVFVGGTSSFDMAPAPYNKYYALDKYCAEHGYAHDEVVFVGDDYGEGGNDSPVYESDFNFIKVDD